MRMSDWSSDVCSSDLLDEGGAGLGPGTLAEHQDGLEGDDLAGLAFQLLDDDHVILGDFVLLAAGFDHCKHGAGPPNSSAFQVLPARLAAAGKAPNMKHRGPMNRGRSEEHTSELQSLMRISYAVFCLKNKNHKHI